MKSSDQEISVSGVSTSSRSSRPSIDHRKHRLLKTFLACSLVLLASPAFAQVAPPLGVAEQFGALGNSGVTGSTGTGTVVNGDVGSYPTATITNFGPSTTVPPYIVHYSADGVVQQARADANAAFTALTQGPGTALADNLSTVGALTPGIYSVNAPDLPSGTSLTLNDPTGTGIFIFNVGSSLTANVNSSVIGTANPCNVYWQVGESATLNGSVFWGTVLADASITIGAGANLVGRALAGTGATGAVTMAGSGGNTIGGCGIDAVSVIPGAVAPTLSKIFNPVTIPVDGISLLTITLVNASTDTAATITTLTDNLPANVLVAPVPNAANTCSGVVTAVSGSGSVVLTGGTIPAATIANNPGSCTVTVNVTSSIVGNYVNTIPAGGLITSSGNNAEPAIATLNVVAGGVTDIPTLSEWSMILLAAMLLLVGGGAMRRRIR